MISPDEILSNSYFIGREDLKDFVYTEYLQLLILKYINKINPKKSYYLFGAYLNRLSFERSKFGNSLDFLTENKSDKDYKKLNTELKKELELEGYSVILNKLSKFRYSLEITSDFLLDETAGKKLKYEIFLNYYVVSNYFKPAIWKLSTQALHVKGYDVNTYIATVRSELSLTILLKIVYQRKSIELIELFDIYTLTTTYMQICETNFFKPNELKYLTKTLIRAKQKLRTPKIKEITSKSFYIIDKNNVEEFFNFSNWVTQLKI